MRLDSLCVACNVSVYACMVLCTGSSLDWEVDWRTMVRCYSLSVSCNSSSAVVDWEVLDFELANWFLSCWNCSSKSAKGHCVSVSSQYSTDESLFPSGTGWSCCMRSKGLSPGCQGCPLCPDFCIWLPCHVSCSTFQRCLAEPSGMIVCGLRTCACCGGAGDRRQKSLTR